VRFFVCSTGSCPIYDLLVYRHASGRISDYPWKVHGYDILVHVGVVSEGIPQASAGMVSSSTPEVTRMMGSSSALTVLRHNPRKKQQEVLHKFLLEGFSANFLKLAECCKFNPDKMFQSRCLLLKTGLRPSCRLRK